MMDCRRHFPPFERPRGQDASVMLDTHYHSLIDRHSSARVDRTPLMLAAIYGHEVIVRMLIDAGASLTIRDARRGRTAAQWAKYKGRHEIAALLSAPREGKKYYKASAIAPAPPEGAAPSKGGAS